MAEAPANTTATPMTTRTIVSNRPSWSGMAWSMMARKASGMAALKANSMTSATTSTVTAARYGRR